MRINPAHLNKLQKVYENQLQKNKINQDNETRDDKLDISNKARQIKEMEKSLDKLPEIRKEKVEQIKTALKNGTYEVEPEKVAEKILNNSQE
ncbi:MAG: flagellar biosynthesis anti-sigma factor FlgM [bacterium]